VDKAANIRFKKPGENARSNFSYRKELATIDLASEAISVDRLSSRFRIATVRLSHR
jgi:hypothetical protein